jgi:lysine 2,3-aminomutase
MEDCVRLNDTPDSPNQAKELPEEPEPPGPAYALTLTIPPGISKSLDHLPTVPNSSGKRRYTSSSPHGAKASMVSPASYEFRKRFFPGVSTREWSDWRWQLRNRVTTLEGLARFIRLSEAEVNALGVNKGALPLSITPYYAALISAEDSAQALRRCVLPVEAELQWSSGEAADPLGEDHDSPVEGIVHRYPDRVLFLVTGFCSTYCRYCTRSRMVGGGLDRFNPGQWEKAITYIESTPGIRDVLLSGGDPLTLNDDQLEWILTRLSRIPHVEFIRLGTKVPAVLPQRVTPNLTRLLRRFHPLWMSLHFTHPDELTPEAAQACTRLADAGIPLGSQTVLLAGINDNVNTLRRLMHGLLKVRVRPYYLYQCDPIPGSAHFRAPVSKGLEMISGLRGYTTGYAVPNYVIDAPDGGGKIPLLPDSVVGRDGDDLLLRNYEGRIYRYPDSVGKG